MVQKRMLKRKSSQTKKVDVEGSSVTDEGEDVSIEDEHGAVEGSVFDELLAYTNDGLT